MPDVTTPPEAPETTMSKVSEMRRIYFAYIIWVSFVGFITFVSMHPVQLPGDTLGIIIGGMLTLVGNTVNYYFSTSMGSSVKSQIMGTLRPPTVAVTPQPNATTTTTTTTEPKVVVPAPRP